MLCSGSRPILCGSFLVVWLLLVGLMLPQVPVFGQDVADSSDAAAATDAGAAPVDVIQDAGARRRGGDDGPALRKKNRQRRKAARVREMASRAQAATQEQLPPPAARQGPWGWYPYWAIPQTQVRRPYSSSITHIPRLGLQHNYPWAYQMGIRVPDDSNPLWDTPNLGPFVGVVQMAKEQALREAEATAGVEDAAVRLMQAGKYREAGRILAAAFKVSTDPKYPLLLTEAFVGLEKATHAELLLRHALQDPSVTRVLHSSIASHFPSKDVFEAKIQAVIKGGQTNLLAAYLLVHSRIPERGVDLLGKLAATEPHDKVAALLYRHYLRKLFSEK